MSNKVFIRANDYLSILPIITQLTKLFFQMIDRDTQFTVEELNKKLNINYAKWILNTQQTEGYHEYQMTNLNTQLWG